MGRGRGIQGIIPSEISGGMRLFPVRGMGVMHSLPWIINSGLFVMAAWGQEGAWAGASAG